MDRLRQIGAAYRTTRQHRPRLDLWMALCLLVPIVAGVVAGLLTGAWAIWVPAGLFLGIALALLVFGRTLQAVQYESIEDVPGAAAAVLERMRGQWFVTPVVGVNKQQEMVHRAVGRCGVVLVTEGEPSRRLDGLVGRERKKLSRVAGDVPVHVVHSGPGADDDTVALGRLQVTLARFPNELSKSEVPKLARRLAPLDKGNVPMPKGHIPRGGGRPR